MASNANLIYCIILSISIILNTSRCPFGHAQSEELLDLDLVHGLDLDGDLDDIEADFSTSNQEKLELQRLIELGKNDKLNPPGELLENSSKSLSSQLTDGSVWLAQKTQITIGKLMRLLFAPVQRYLSLFIRYRQWIQRHRSKLEGQDKMSLLGTLQAAYSLEEQPLLEHNCPNSDQLGDCENMNFVWFVIESVIDLLEQIDDYDLMDANQLDEKNELERKLINLDRQQIDESMRRFRRTLYESAIERLEQESIHFIRMSIKMVAFYAISKLFEEASIQETDLVWPMIVMRFTRYDFNLVRKYFKSSWKKAALRHVAGSIKRTFSSNDKSWS